MPALNNVRLIFFCKDSGINRDITAEVGETQFMGRLPATCAAGSARNGAWAGDHRRRPFQTGIALSNGGSLRRQPDRDRGNVVLRFA